jgi:hypothetical protein
VFAGERDEAEACLVSVEFQDSAKRLLRDRWQIVGIIQKHPGDRIRNRANSSNKLGQTLANRGDSTVICGTQTESHDGLMGRIRNTLTLQMFGDPCIRQHRLADSRGSAEDKMGRIFDSRTQEFDGFFLA